MNKFDKTMKDIRRMNYRFNVMQNGGKFIPVSTPDEKTIDDPFLGKVSNDDYNRFYGFSGYDEVEEWEEVI